MIDIITLFIFGFVLCLIAFATIGRMAFVKIVKDNQEQETDDDMKDSDK